MASYDLIVVTDATASMGQYLASLRSSIPEIIALSTLSGVFKRVAVVAYKDYTEPEQVVEWSGWDSPDLPKFVENLAPTGGGDYPEAAKSALIHVLREVKRGGGDNTLVLWYADAPPHHPSMRSYLNDKAEINAFPAGSTDWVKLSNLARKMKVTVFSFIPRALEDSAAASFYVLLSQLTGGLCVSSDTQSGSAISRLTLEVILEWMGQGADIDTRLQSEKVKFSQFAESPRDVQPRLTDELAGALGFLPPPLNPQASATKPAPLRPILLSQLHASNIPSGQNLPTMSFAQRIQNPSDTHYREQVYASLHNVIETNVVALTLNNVFGQVWRAVCSQPPTPEQTKLLNAFSQKVGSITDPTKKKALQDWLDNSFDATAKIEEMLAKVSPGGPKVCLDLDTEIGLTRTELLEVSKSCYSEVLRKVASVFTHLKLVEADVEMAPGHRYIPLSLSAQEFFRTVPHLVVPGTLYPPRSASITAVLALVTGVPFLREKALEILAPLKGTWVDLEIPENVSFECAKFLLSAPEGLVLSSEEKKTYQAMRRYKLIELNMQSNLNVKLGWTPEKTTGVGDHKVECSCCNVMRSVTLMSEDCKGVCGLCVDLQRDKQEAIKFQTDGEMASCWVECSMKDCRAQYVVEDHKGLNVRPKCWYCRQKRKCPWQECSRCKNRVITPVYLRNKGNAKYLCYACQPNSQVPSIVEVETSVHALVKENGLPWLGVKPNTDLFHGKSAFKLMTEHGTSVFDSVPVDKKMQLNLNSKPVHEPHEARQQVERWIETGTVELGCCALCFGDMPKNKLMPACGRSGCKQRADNDCLRAWYSNAKPGRLLNVMELMCPFCRRLPDHHTISRYNPQAMALGDLKNAISDRQWFYAWCIECGFAKQAFERVCAQGPLPPITGFRCRECIEISERAVMMVQREEDDELEGYRQNRERRRAVADEIKNQKAIRITRCPTCKTPVEKVDGCNHIECDCGTHFCHVCGAGDANWSSGDCYEHMSEKHGGCWDFEMHDEDEDN